MIKAEIEKYQAILLKVLAFSLGAVGLLVVVKLTFFLLAPFLIALLLSFMMEPLVSQFQKIKIPRGFAVSLSMIVFFGGVGSLLTLAITRIIIELTKLYASLPSYGTESLTMLGSLLKKGTALYIQLPPEVLAPVQNTILTVTENITKLLTGFAKSILDTLTSLPGMLIFTLITIVATFFMTKDKYLIRDFLFRQLPDIWVSRLRSLKSSLFSSLLGFLKAQSIILSLTFTESFVGLSIIGVDYALIIALCIALIDILPILGTGTILVPWSIVSFAFGDYRLGICLLVLWAVIICVRYMVEPKIMGASLGIHPLIALISMFVGLKLIGVAGVLVGPAVVIFIKACMNAGIIPKFK